MNFMIYLESTEQYDKFGSFIHILLKILYCRGASGETKGTAFVVYDDIFDAKNAVDHLSGFNVAGRQYYFNI